MLHNDIKADNVLLTLQNSSLHPVLIDFGKCRKTSNAKRYRLTPEEQRKYHRKHWHIAPQLIEGSHSQSFASDVYSFGVLISKICHGTHMLTEDERLKDIYIACMRKNPEARPALKLVLNQFNF